MRTEQERQQKNGGFTLVEMIVAVAITAVFSAVVLTAVAAGSRLYRSISGSTRVQMDTQELTDSVEKLIVNAGESIYYAYGSGKSPGAPISDDIDGSMDGDRTLLLCSIQKNKGGAGIRVVDVLDWRESEQKLYYSRQEITAAGTSMLTEPSVYGEGIREFHVDVSRADSDGIIRFQLITENLGKKLRTLHTVDLRNPVKIMLPGSQQQEEGGQPQT
ncbi:prepilin-type N-terminal cleavage/methylation domain-containing protein [Blautia massiliensis]|uniref:PilW family protein n=1 Tax=Blautia TaxID=572511 RepID=UPI00156E0860|nr:MULTISPECIES: prepilin-type N-terminal cleavage/methylation domain-containing protein [Blautia]MCC2724767.1 prepilin-type N-terminal cleavage/methylation domain-containing protein [Blautia sp. MSK22_86]NSF57980.1 prepilin-type N-terminal cleavage/methylation domain-containing protein [Blautia massiliensis (ex Durand et al. 2017)]NSK73398.1 prepilin-type N-terminal cleavage/methylation domain-containing protein [Blautia massiliensis (ex Durand et al. 2017)]